MHYQGELEEMKDFPIDNYIEFSDIIDQSDRGHKIMY